MTVLRAGPVAERSATGSPVAFWVVSQPPVYQYPPGPQHPPGPQQPPVGQSPPAPKPNRGAGVVIALLVVAIIATAAVGVVLFVGDGGGAGDGAGGESADGRIVRPESLPPEASTIQIVGASEGPDGLAMRAAIADVDGFWRRQFERTFDRPYRTVTGGFHAVTSADREVPCTESPEEVDGNAFYCPSEDVVAWDAQNLIPHMVDDYGPLGLGLVIAHEWAHAVQARIGATDRNPVLVLEQQADCYAGAWVADVRRGGADRYFVVDDRTLDLAVAGFLELRDAPGMTRADAGAHGTAFDRIRAFQEGVEGGVDSCDYTSDDLSSRLVDLPFTSQADFDSGGNLPLQDSFDLTIADLEDFWTAAWASVASGRSAPDRSGFDAPTVNVNGSTEGRAPDGDCDDAVGITEGVAYCPSSNELNVAEDGVAAEVHRRIGDFALGAVLGSGYALAAMHQLGTLDAASAATTRTADCLAGVWSASVFAEDRENAQLRLSPGDLDEAVSALLSTADHGSASRTGSGAARVAAYRDGFMDGADACLS